MGTLVFQILDLVRTRVERRRLGPSGLGVQRARFSRPEIVRRLTVALIDAHLSTPPFVNDVRYHGVLITRDLVVHEHLDWPRPPVTRLRNYMNIYNRCLYLSIWSGWNTVGILGTYREDKLFGKNSRWASLRCCPWSFPCWAPGNKMSQCNRLWTLRSPPIFYTCMVQTHRLLFTKVSTFYV